MHPNDAVDAVEKTSPYGVEQWGDPEQVEILKNTEADLPFTVQTRQSSRERRAENSNPYGDDFVIDRKDLKKKAEELAGLEEVIASRKLGIIDDQDKEWLKDRSKPEVENDDELQQSYEKKN